MTNPILSQQADVQSATPCHMEGAKVALARRAYELAADQSADQWVKVRNLEMALKIARSNLDAAEVVREKLADDLARAQAELQTAADHQG